MPGRDREGRRGGGGGRDRRPDRPPERPQHQQRGEGGGKEERAGREQRAGREEQRARREEPAAAPRERPKSAPREKPKAEPRRPAAADGDGERDRQAAKRSSPPIDRPGGPGGAAPPRTKAAGAKPAAGQGKVSVGSTGNSPELVETVPITTSPGAEPRVVLSFGPGAKTDSPLPDIGPGDRLQILAELEVTTDAEDPNHPGLMGTAYGYAPEVEATLVLASGPGETGPGVGRAIALGRPWRRSVTHEQHHAVIDFDAPVEIPRGGPGWSGDSYVNVVLSASSPEAQAGNVLLVGQNEKTPTVVQDMAGIRVVRRRGGAGDPAPQRDSSCLVAGVPVAKAETVVFATRLDGLAEGEQLLVKAKLVTDASSLGYAARISTRLFLADSPDQLEPGGTAASVASWKGHVSKFTGFNCLPGAGPEESRKFGVARIESSPPGQLYVNLVAVSAAPFGGESPGDALPIDRATSLLEVFRYPPELFG